MRRKGKENSRLYKISKNIISYITSSFWEVFQRLFIVPKQTLMSFIYYKRVKKEKLQFWRKILKVGAHKGFSHTLRKFGTPCESLAHLAKIWHTLRILAHLANLMIFALRNALFSSILLLIVLATPCQVWQGVLKYSKAQILHVLQILPQSWPISVIKKLPKTLKLTKNWLVTFARSLTCQLG